MNNIENIYKMLNSDSLSEENEGERLAKELKDLSLLICPPAPPYVWIKCANILSEKDDCELEPYLFGLLEWLRDLNWPGALIIFERLKKFPVEKLTQPFTDCVMKATKSNYKRWLMFLSYFLLENESLKAELSQEVIENLLKGC